MRRSQGSDFARVCSIKSPNVHELESEKVPEAPFCNTASNWISLKDPHTVARHDRPTDRDRSVAPTLVCQGALRAGDVLQNLVKFGHEILEHTGNRVG